MTEIILSNSLTQEEKLQVPRLLGHDSIENLLMVRSAGYKLLNNGKKEMYDRLGLLLEHSGFLEYAVDDLTQEDEFKRYNWSDHYSQKNIINFHRRFLEVTERKITLDIRSFRDFLSLENVFYASLFNLVKNACNADGKNGEVSLSVNPVDKLEKNIVYIPNGFQEYQRYVKFSVHNKKPFPSDKPLLDFIQKSSPKRGSSGFGLYFVGLASRVMRAPIHIESNQTEGTTVSLFHPDYESEVSK